MSKQRGVTYPQAQSPVNSSDSGSITSRFVEAMARRGVPELGARAVLRQIRKTAELCRAGRLSDDQAQARIALTLIDAEDKATELVRVEIKKLAEAIGAGELSLGAARAKLRGAA